MSLLPEQSDADLLISYQAGSQSAFAALVTRYTAAVYSAAYRQSRDQHLAEDITQAVFLILSQKAASLAPTTVIPAWLHRVTRYCAANALRIEANHRSHERRAAQMASRLDAEVDAPADRAQLSAVIDNAVGMLQGLDREVIILRYFHGKAHAVVAADLGLSADAAAKRAERALAKLRGILSRKGHETTVASLTASLGALALTPIPPQLPGTLANLTSSVSVTSVSYSIAKGAMRTMFWTSFKAVVVVSALSIVLAGGITAAVLGRSDQPPVSAVPAPQLVVGPATHPVVPVTHSVATQVSTTQPANAGMSDDRVLRELKRITPRVQFHAKLGEAIDFMRDITGLKIDVEWDKLNAVGITAKTPVTMDVRNVKMYVALTGILDSAATKPGIIAWEVAQGAVVIRPVNSPAPQPK